MRERMSVDSSCIRCRQIPPRGREAILKIIRKKNRRGLRPQLRFLLDILGYQALTLPVIYLEKFPPRQLLWVWYGAPDKVLKSCDSGRSINDGFALHDLRGC